MNASGDSPPGHTAGAADPSPPFRFYDNRQKYLAFVTSCNEKSAIARRAAHEVTLLRPTPPAVRMFDAGMGDGTVIARVMRSTHRQFPTVPMFVVAKEISLEDVRLGLEKLPDRFFEHPATVFVVTNLNYAEAPRLMPRDAQLAAALNWQEVRLTGATADEYAQQIEELSTALTSGWQTRPSQRTGNPMIVRPSVLVMYARTTSSCSTASSRSPARSSSTTIWCSPRSPGVHAWGGLQGAEGARAAGPQSCARRPAARDPVLGPGSGTGDHPAAVAGGAPLQVDRHELLAGLRRELAREAREFNLAALRIEGRFSLRDAHAAVGDRRPHRYVDPVCRLECCHLT